MIPYQDRSVKELPIKFPFFTVIFTFLLGLIPKYNSQKWHFDQLLEKRNSLFTELRNLSTNFQETEIQVQEKIFKLFEGDITNISVNSELNLTEPSVSKLNNLIEPFNELQMEFQELQSSKYDLISLSNRHHIDWKTLNLESLEAQFIENLEQKLQHLLNRLKETVQKIGNYNTEIRVLITNV